MTTVVFCHAYRHAFALQCRIGAPAETSPPSTINRPARTVSSGAKVKRVRREPRSYSRRSRSPTLSSPGMTAVTLAPRPVAPQTSLLPHVIEQRRDTSMAGESVVESVAQIGAGEAAGDDRGDAPGLQRRHRLLAARADAEVRTAAEKDVAGRGGGRRVRVVVARRRPRPSCAGASSR